MWNHLNHTRLLRYAGLFTWVMVGMPLVYSWWVPFESGDLASDVGSLRPTPWLGWGSYVLFGICYGWLTRALGARPANWLDYAVLLALTACGVGVSYFSGSGLGSILLMVSASVLPWILPLGAGVAWLILSQFVVMPVFMRALNFPLADALLQSLLYAGFSGFVFVVGLVARQQAQAREEQRRLNAELRATRMLLAESARTNERTRISRELHDLLGHHLTALSLNLEVAGHLSQGRVKDHVQQAHTLARLLLTDVREVVSQLRENGAIDLSSALQPLADNVPALDIHMDVQSPLTLDDPERAHVLLRCAQEIITNTVRHAGARNLWISARRDDDCIHLRAHDDGRGADQFEDGNGLRGMRERLAQYGGDLTIETRPRAGFKLHLLLPASAAGAAAHEGVCA